MLEVVSHKVDQPMFAFVIQLRTDLQDKQYQVQTIVNLIRKLNLQQFHNQIDGLMHKFQLNNSHDECLVDLVSADILHIDELSFEGILVLGTCHLNHLHSPHNLVYFVNVHFKDELGR